MEEAILFGDAADWQQKGQNAVSVRPAERCHFAGRRLLSAQGHRHLGDTNLFNEAFYVALLKRRTKTGRIHGNTSR